MKLNHPRVAPSRRRLTPRGHRGRPRFAFEALENRIALALHIENFSNDIDPTLPGFDSWDADPLTIPGGDTDSDPNTTQGPDEFQIPAKTSSKVSIWYREAPGIPSYALGVFPAGEWYEINFFANRGQPGGLGPDGEVAAVGIDFTGIGRIEFFGNNGEKTVNSHEWRWQHVAVTSNDPSDSGFEMGAIQRVRITGGSAGLHTLTGIAVDDIAVLVFDAGFSNNAPWAVDDSVVVRAGRSQGIYVLDNDSDLDGDTLTIQDHLKVLPSKGIAEVHHPTDGSDYIRYTSILGYVGEDSFTYAISDGRGGTATGTVFISVEAPTAVDDFASALSGEPVDIDVLKNDINPGGGQFALAIIGASDPGRGSVVVHDGLITYTPDVAFQGSDSFSYTFRDEFGNSSTANVQVEVKLRPQAFGGVIKARHGAPGPLGGQVGFIASGGPVTASIVDDAKHGHVRLEIVGDQVYIEYETGLGRVIGPDRFTYRLFDGNSYSHAATVEIRVPNYAPIAHPDIYWLPRLSDPVPPPGEEDLIRGNVLQGDGFIDTFGTARDNGMDQDQDNDPLQVVEITQGPVWGTLYSLNSNGDFVYELPWEFPELDPETGIPTGRFMADGVDSFRYRISDGHSSSETTVLLLRHIDPPYPLKFDISAGHTLFAQAAEGIRSKFGGDLYDDVRFEQLPSHGTLWSSGDGAFTYEPESGFVGSDSFLVSILLPVPIATPFGTAQSWVRIPRPVTITVRNDAPEPAADHYSIPWGERLVVGAPGGLLANDFDRNAQRLRVDSITDPDHGQILSWSEDGAFTYISDPGFVGMDGFEYRVSDGFGGFSTRAVFVNVTSHRPRLALDLDFVNVQNFPVPQTPAPLVGAIEWSDRDGDAVTPLIVPGHGPQHGRAALRVVGSQVRVEYYPHEGHFAPHDEFRVAITDGLYQSDYKTVRVIRQNNTAPSALDDFFVIQNRPIGLTDTDPVVFAFPGVNWNDEDPDDDFLKTTLVTGPAHGTLMLEQDGRFIYRPQRDYFGTDTFVYSVDDGSGIASEATVTLRIVDERVPTVFDDQVIRTWQEDLVPADIPSDDLADWLPYGQLVVDNDIRPSDWQDWPAIPNSVDWELQLVARPRQVAATDRLLIPEGEVQLFSYGWAEFNPVVQHAGQYVLAFETAEVEATYAFQDLRHPGYLSNFAQVRFVVSPPAQGTHTSLLVPRIDGGSIDVQASSGTLLEKVELVNPPTPLPQGFTTAYDKVFDFVISGMGPGGAATVTLTYPQPLPAGVTYMKYGRRDDDRATVEDELQPHWYEFLYDSATGTGAQIVGNQIIVHFVDGLRGDNNLLADGVIFDPGAPAFPRLPPVVTTDQFSIDEDQSLVVAARGVLGNDASRLGGSLTSVLVSGPAHATLALQANGSFTYLPELNFNGIDSFTYKASDGWLDSEVATVTIAVNPVNDEPSVTISGPPIGVRGQPLTFNLSATDPEPDDLVAGFIYRIDWNGDGIVDEVLIGPALGIAIDHVFPVTGTYNIVATATDRNGAVSNLATHSIEVRTVALIGSDLFVGGTAANDHIDFFPDRHGQVMVRMNRDTFGPFQPTRRLVAFGQEGNDKISKDLLSHLTAQFHGDGGNDHLFAGLGGNSLLVGGTGDDHLHGSVLGRNILLGGLGRDHLHGQHVGSNLLIGGTTAYDSNDSALLAILAEWTSDNDFDTRVANLRDGGGLNGGFVLVPDDTVFDDGAMDQLFGGLVHNWLFRFPGDKVHGPG